MSLDISFTNKPCEHCGEAKEGFSANITHNLIAMADAARIYECLWESHGKIAGEITLPLEVGLKLMKSDPVKFKKHDSENGWGTYDNFIGFIEKVLLASKKMPNAKIEISR